MAEVSAQGLSTTEGADSAPDSTSLSEEEESTVAAAQANTASRMSTSMNGK